MNIRIDDNLSLLSVQQEFHLEFPYLKINFIETIKSRTGTIQKKLLDKSEKTFTEFILEDRENSIIITPELTVSELVKQITNSYRLEIQLCRKSGRIWLETSATDSWTLEMQNKQGEALNFD